MWCTNCGQKLKDGTTFCTNCGKPVAEKTGQGQNMQDGNSDKHTRKKSHTSTAVIIAATAIGTLSLVVIVVATIYFLHISRNNVSNEQLQYEETVAADENTAGGETASPVNTTAESDGSGTQTTVSTAETTPVPTATATPTPKPTSTPAPTAAPTAAPAVISGSAYDSRVEVDPSDSEMVSPYYVRCNGDERIRSGPGLGYSMITMMEEVNHSELLVLATCEVYDSSLHYGNTWGFVQYFDNGGGYGWCYLGYTTRIS